MIFLSSLETPRPFKKGRWQLWEDKSSESTPESQIIKESHLLFKHISPVPCVTRVCLSVLALRQWVASFTPSQSASQLCLGGLGLRCKGEEKEYENEGICQVKPLEAQPQPKLFSLGVYVLLTEEWLSLRRFQWTLYNHVATRVASV